MVSFYRFVSIFFLVFLLSGCSSKVPKIEKIRPLPENFSCRVAVLPFIDKSDFPRGEKLLYKVFSAELAAAGFDVVPEGDVMDMYRQLKIYPSEDPTDEQLKIIVNRLHPEIFIGGDILRMNERKDAGQVETEMTVVLYIFDAKTGLFLWGTYHKHRGKDYNKVLHFGTINSIIGLAEAMSQEVIELWLEEGMKTCSNE